MSGKKILTVGDAYEFGRKFGLELGYKNSLEIINDLISVDTIGDYNQGLLDAEQKILSIKAKSDDK